MFEGLLRRLTDAGREPLAEPDETLALAALLVRIARSDGVYAAAEVEQIGRVLVARFGLSPFEAARLRGEAEALEAEAPDTVRFTRALKDAVPLDRRVGLIEAMWEVALADGERDNDEANLLRLVANLLGINDTDNNSARLRVEARRA